jgi:hypothetical protein
MSNTDDTNMTNSSAISASDATYELGNAVSLTEPDRTDLSLTSGRCIKATTETDTVKARVTTLGRNHKRELTTD